MEEPKWRIEAHIWFGNFDEYTVRERELLELLGKIISPLCIILVSCEY